jgi:hypothetical protein
VIFELKESVHSVLLSVSLSENSLASNTTMLMAALKQASKCKSTQSQSLIPGFKSEDRFEECINNGNTGIAINRVC